MAHVAIGLPTFEGREDEDVENFIYLYQNYLNAIGLNPVGAGGPPTNRDRALGILRGCMRGSAAVWFDDHITGKGWRLNNLSNNHGQANIGAIRARTMAQITGSLKNGTWAHTYANVVANAAVTVANAGSQNVAAANGINLWIPAEAFDQDWSILDGEPCDETVTNIGGNAAVPVVLGPIRVGGALYYLRNKYPTVVEASRKTNFHTLYQGNDAIRTFYNKLKKYGKLLQYGDNLIEAQFFRGISPESMDDVDRMGEKPLSEMVNALEKVEKRRAEMRLGLDNRKAKQNTQSQNIVPVQMPPVSQQEPTILKPVTSQGISQEQLEQLLKLQADNLSRSFQAQFDALQARIPTPTPAPVPTPQPIQEVESKPPSTYEQYIRNYTDNYKKSGGNSKIARLVTRMMEKMENRKIDKEISNMFNDLSLRDPEDMDTSINSARAREIAADSDGEYTIEVVRKKSKY